MSTRTYQGLVVWQKAHVLVLAVYRASKLFPTGERFALTSQVRRSASSVAANIVEGYARRNDNVFLNHLSMAKASLEETKYHLLVAKDLEYLPMTGYTALIKQADEVGRLLHSFMKSLRA